MGEQTFIQFYMVLRGIYFKFCNLKLHFIQDVLIDGLMNQPEFTFTLAVTTEASKSCKNPSCDGVQAKTLARISSDDIWVPFTIIPAWW